MSNKKPLYSDWLATVPPDRANDPRYDLEKAYNALDFDTLERWRTASDEDLQAGLNHLPSVVPNSSGGYDFLKRHDHPSIDYELSWFAGDSPDAEKFRASYGLDTSLPYYKYYPLRSDAAALALHAYDRFKSDVDSRSITPPSFVSENIEPAFPRNNLLNVAGKRLTSEYGDQYVSSPYSTDVNGLHLRNAPLSIDPRDGFLSPLRPPSYFFPNPPRHFSFSSALQKDVYDYAALRDILKSYTGPLGGSSFLPVNNFYESFDLLDRMGDFSLDKLDGSGSVYNPPSSSYDEDYPSAPGDEDYPSVFGPEFLLLPPAAFLYSAFPGPTLAASAALAAPFAGYKLGQYIGNKLSADGGLVERVWNHFHPQPSE